MLNCDGLKLFFLVHKDRSKACSEEAIPVGLGSYVSQIIFVAYSRVTSLRAECSPIAAQLFRFRLLLCGCHRERLG